MIRITLRGEPRLRTGTLRVNDTAYELATWHRAAQGVVIATTDDGRQITYTAGTDGGGTITGIGTWLLSGCVWDGVVMTGVALPGVTDGEMAAMFPGAGWDDAEIIAGDG